MNQYITEQTQQLVRPFIYDDEINQVRQENYDIKCQNEFLRKQNLDAGSAIIYLHNELCRKEAKKTEKIEYLLEDALYDSLMLTTRGNDGNISQIPFCLGTIKNVKIVKIIGNEKIDEMLEISLKIDCREKKVHLSKNFSVEKLPVIFRMEGMSFFVKRNDRRVGELLANYISYKLNEAELIIINDLAGWNMEGEIPQYMYAGNPNILQIESTAMRKIIVNRKNIMNSCEKTIKNFFEQGKSFKSIDKHIVLTLFLHYAVFFSIFEKKNCLMRKYLLVVASNLELRCEDIVYLYLQVFNRYDRQILDLNVTKKKLIRNIQKYKDEPLIIKGDSQISAFYDRKKRQGNIETLLDACFAGVALNDNCNAYKIKAPLVIACNQIPLDIPYEDSLQLYIEKEDINIEIFRELLGKPYILGEYILCLINYFESNYKTADRKIDDGLKRYLEQGEINCATNVISYAVFMTLYNLIKEFLWYSGCNINTFWGDDRNVEKSICAFLDSSEENSDCSGLSEILIQGIKILKDKKLLKFVNRSTGEVDSNYKGKAALIFYDDECIYFSYSTLKERLLPQICTDNISANQFLISLEQEGFIALNNLQKKSYEKKITITSTDGSKTRQRLIAVKREAFYEIGKVDII